MTNDQGHDMIPMGADLISEAFSELQAYLLHLEGWVRACALKCGVEEPKNPTLKDETAGWGNGQCVGPHCKDN